MESTSPTIVDSSPCSRKRSGSVELGLSKRSRNIPCFPSTFTSGLEVHLRHTSQAPKMALAGIPKEPKCCSVCWDTYISSFSAWSIAHVVELVSDTVSSDSWPDICSQVQPYPAYVSSSRPPLSPYMRCLVCGALRDTRQMASHLFSHACRSSRITLQFGTNSQSDTQLLTTISFISTSSDDMSYSVYWIPTEFVLSKYFTTSAMESLYRSLSNSKDVFYLYLLRYYTPESLDRLLHGICNV